MYRVDGTDESLTLAQLEDQSLRFARAINKKYGIKPNDVVSIVAKDKVTDTPGFPSLHVSRKDMRPSYSQQKL